MLRLLFLSLILIGWILCVIEPCKAQVGFQKTPAALPSFEVPTIAFTLPVLGDFKRVVLDQSYNLQFDYTGEVLENRSRRTR